MESVVKKKNLTPKQKMALEMLTSGKGYKYKEICETVGINMKTLYSWRKAPEYTHFQERLDEINNERWLATIDVAREAAYRLCQEGKTDMVKFVLQNAGYNPSQKVEADLHTDIVINVEE